MKEILITGGAGFIGSHLCFKLLSEGHKITCVDNFSSGSIKNIDNCLDNPNFILRKHNICNQYFRKVKGELYNLACPASPIQYKKNPLLTFNTSIIGTKNMLEKAKTHKTKFLQASTSEVYGDPLVHPQSENYRGNVDTIGDRACYKESKRAAETLVNEYRKIYNIDTKIVRLFNVYGPNMQKNDGRVISSFITKALANEDIIIHGDGSQTRSFCYVSDIIDALIRVMDSNIHLPINLGNEEEITLKELANLIISLTNSKSKIVYSKADEDGCKKRRPDITFAKNNLNWKPKIKLTEGLQKTIDYFKNI